MTPEGKLQKKAIVYAEKRGLLVLRNHMGRGVRTGRPDVEYLPGQGRVFFIEFKVPGGKGPSARQQLVIADLVQRGYDVHVCYSFEDARQIIDASIDSLAKPC